MEAISLSYGLFSRNPSYFHNEKTEMEKTVSDCWTSSYQV
ncbi:zinc finger protein 560, isoform CRA_a [Mus musculus]|uniref:Zinc finger protein 560 n=1 Tax=Mus musculus TaxID=10090 RepID=A0A1L1SUU9_MOUSE|nr:zinc finger protein 560, isoform CRA_a [Mus musculus]